MSKIPEPAKSTKGASIIYGEGDIVYEGDSLFTGSSSNCSINVIKGTDSTGIVVIGENTSLSLSFSALDSKKIIVLDAGNAEIEADKTRDQNDTEYSSPAIRMGVKGTKFSVDVSKSGDTKVVLKEGKIWYRVNPNMKASIVQTYKSAKEIDTFLKSQSQDLSEGETLFIAKRNVQDFYRDLGLYEAVFMDKPEKFNELDQNLDLGEFKTKLQYSYEKNIRFIKNVSRKIEKSKSDNDSDFITLNTAESETAKPAPSSVKKESSSEITENQSKAAAKEESVSMNDSSLKKNADNTSIKKKDTAADNAQAGNLSESENTFLFFFAPGKAYLTEKEKRKIHSVLKQIGRNQNVKISIEGYSDQSPIRKSHFKSNLYLSLERANAVLKLLERYIKVSQNRISVHGFGTVPENQDRKVILKVK